MELQQLEDVITQEAVWKAIQTTLEQAKQQRAADNREWLVLPLDMDIYGGQLPDEFKSSRITVFRHDANTKVERHPNAIQIVRLIEGQCNIRTLSSDEHGWSSDPKDTNAETLQGRWSVVEPNVWHCPLPVDDDGWAVLGFHTVPANELIDESPDNE